MKMSKLPLEFMDCHFCLECSINSAKTASLKRKIRFQITLVLLICIATLAVTFAACTNDSAKTTGAKEDIGALPDLTDGDTWTHRFSLEGTEYDFINTVTGKEVKEENTCHIVQCAYEPPMMGIVDSATMKLDKHTRFVRKVQTSDALKGTQFEVDTTYEYEITGKPYYPLSIGKECTIIETMTTLIPGNSQRKPGSQITPYLTSTKTFTYIVEAIEAITVPAGTFTCFKIGLYDDNSNLIRTSWKSYQVKQLEVKGIDGKSNEITELISYSFSQ